MFFLDSGWRLSKASPPMTKKIARIRPEIFRNPRQGRLMDTVPLLRRLVPHRFELILVLLGLVLTLLALLPIDPQGPFNARTYERLPDARLYFTWTGAMLEPVSSIGHALLGAPVPKQAAIASLAWVLAAALVWGWMRRTRNIPLRILGAGGAALTAVLAFLAYAGLYFILYGVALGGIALLLGAGPLLLREARLWRKGRLPE